MPITPVSDKSIACPYCHTENTIIGSDLAPGTIISCSSCKRAIGPYSDMRDPIMAPESVHGVYQLNNS